MFNLAVIVTPPYAAEMVTDLVLETGDVVITNVAPVLPPGTVTLDGTLADDELSLSDTVAPPAGAGAFRVTVPVELLPPATLVGLTARELKVILFKTMTVTVATLLVKVPSLAR